MIEQVNGSCRWGGVRSRVRGRAGCVGVGELSGSKGGEGGVTGNAVTAQNESAVVPASLVVGSERRRAGKTFKKGGGGGSFSTDLFSPASFLRARVGPFFCVRFCIHGFISSNLISM